MGHSRPTQGIESLRPGVERRESAWATAYLRRTAYTVSQMSDPGWRGAAVQGARRGWLTRSVETPGRASGAVEFRDGGLVRALTNSLLRLADRVFAAVFDSTPTVTRHTHLTPHITHRTTHKPNRIIGHKVADINGPPVP